MKRICILFLAVILLLSICACGTTQDIPPHFKGLSWGDSLADVKKVEKKLEENQHDDGEVFWLCHSSVPFADDDMAIGYYFTDDGHLKSISITGSIENAKINEVDSWFNKYYDYKGELNESVLVYISKEEPSTGLTAEKLFSIGDDKGNDNAYSMWKITFWAFHLVEEGK